MNVGCWLILLLACTPMPAAEDPRQVPPAIAEALTKASAVGPAEAIKLLDGTRVPPHPLLLLARAQACWRLAQEAPADADRVRLIAEAETGFRTARDRDPGIKQAHLGMAQCAAARGDWLAASRAGAAGFDPVNGDLNSLGFVAQTALRAGDWRLAALAVQLGILRFPEDDALRRIEVAVLIRAGRGEEARQAVLALLARAPGDAELWRNLAWTAQATGRVDETLGALEAAVAAAPEHRDTRRQLAEAQLGRGLPRAALATIRPLIGDPPTAAALADEGLMLLASRTATDSNQLALARAWLGAIPEPQRSRSCLLQLARLAAQAGDTTAVHATLDTLIAGGEQDPQVLIWAASLAEAGGDQARAELLYLQAAGGEGKSDAATMMRLVAFYLKVARRNDAMVTLAAYLAKHPDDVQAKAMQDRLLERR